MVKQWQDSHLLIFAGSFSPWVSTWFGAVTHQSRSSRSQVPSNPSGCQEETHLNIWVCLKIVYPYTQWLMIIIPTKWLFHWEYSQHFQTYPYFAKALSYFSMPLVVLVCPFFLVVRTLQEDPDASIHTSSWGRGGENFEARDTKLIEHAKASKYSNLFKYHWNPISQNLIPSILHWPMKHVPKPRQDRPQKSIAINLEAIGKA